MATVDWIDDRNFRVGRVAFHTSITERFRSTSDNFLLVKHRHMVERYEEMLARHRPKRIVELGICQGGSAAFLSLLAQPDRFVAVDIKEHPTKGLEDFIVEHDLAAHVHTHYGFDQADDTRLRRMIASEFSGAPLDLVVDDASHRLEPTRVSFNVLFPKLRPGGLFVIEDWAGLHHLGEALRLRAERDPGVRTKLERMVRSGHVSEVPLTVFLFELVLASAYAPSVVAEVIVSDDWACVVRGPSELPTDFDLSRVYDPWARGLIGRIS